MSQTVISQMVREKVIRKYLNQKPSLTIEPSLDSLLEMCVCALPSSLLERAR